MLKAKLATILLVIFLAAPGHALLGLPDLLGPLVDLLPIEEIVELVEDLPLPILGPDKYEDDDSPISAVFTGLAVLDHLELLGLDRLLYTHNFHTPDDEDWMMFFAQEGQDCTLRTRDLLPGADTHLSVYRERRPGEEMPEGIIESCLEEFVRTEDDRILIPLACNDDVKLEQNLRSEVRFIAPRSGRYWVRVVQSPKQRTKRTDGAETTYNYESTTKFSFASTLVANLHDSETDDAVEDGEIFVTPMNLRISENEDGNYTVNGIPDGNYNIRAEGPNYEAQQRSVGISGGKIHFENFPLKNVALPEGEDEGEDEVIPEGEDEGEGEVTPEGEDEGEGEVIPEGEDEGEVVNEGEAEEEGEFVPEGEDEGEGEGIAEGELEGELEGEDHTEGEVPVDDYHSADYLAPAGVLDISELLRVIQFYNAGGIHCDLTSEDGYGPGHGDASCGAHSMDFIDNDFKLELREVLRAIQFFNLGGMHACTGSEDGFCPGPPLS